MRQIGPTVTNPDEPMSAMWDTPYGHAMLKIERANKHIEDFGKRLLASSNRYGPACT